MNRTQIISYKNLGGKINFEGVPNLYTNPAECRRLGC